MLHANILHLGRNPNNISYSDLHLLPIPQYALTPKDNNQMLSAEYAKMTSPQIQKLNKRWEIKRHH